MLQFLGSVVLVLRVRELHRRPSTLLHHSITVATHLRFWRLVRIDEQELWPLFSGLHEAKFGAAPFEEHKVIGHAALEGSTWPCLYLSCRCMCVVCYAVHHNPPHADAVDLTTTVQLVMIPNEDSTSSSSASSSSVVATSAAQEAWWIAELDKSVLENKKIDRILGCIYGNCLGDAVGLGT